MDEYVIGSPLFDNATLNLDNGNTFVITAENNSPKNVYISSTNLNGTPYAHSYLNFEAIQKGGNFTFKMSDKPNMDWAKGKDDVPYSLSFDREIKSKM